jgi:hypothetical protein
MTEKRLSRRAVLRGAGVAVALPFLESVAGRAARAAGTDPKRLVYLYQPNGMDGWRITNVAASETTAHVLGGALSPLVPYQSQLTIVRGLDNVGGGTGVHNSASANWLTGKPMQGTAVVKVGISADQVAAAALGSQTAFPSLQIGAWPELYNRIGEDSGVNGDYLKHLSWRSDGTPMRPVNDPAALFAQLFAPSSGGTQPATAVTALKMNKSILDYVLADGNALSARLSATDRLKVDEYLTQVRATEQKIAAQLAGLPPPVTACGSTATAPAATFTVFRDYLRVMSDLLALAFACDKTRIATFHLGLEFGDAMFRPTVDAAAHHSAVHTGDSYFGGATQKAAYLESINQFYATELAYFLSRLAAVSESSGTLLDNSAVVFGSGLQYSHTSSDLYLVVAGRLGGALRPGRHVRVPGGTPLPNLHRTLLAKLGASPSDLGAGTGELTVL